MEKINVTGGAFSDFLVYQSDTSQYKGAGGFDTFYADFSAWTEAVTWVNGKNATTSGLSDEVMTTLGATRQVAVSGMETLLLLTGSADDTITQNVTATNDEFRLGAGNDKVFGNSGNDTIDGGAGDDTAVYAGLRASYTISTIPGGYTIASGSDGTDTLFNVEFAKFSDKTITLGAPVDNTAPMVATFNPADEATNIAVASDIVITFSEPVVKGTGNIVLKTSAGSIVATYDVAISTNLSLSGSTLTINPSADLSFGTGYKVEFAAGTFKDTSDNLYAGTTSYNFTTVAAPNVLPTGAVTLSGTPAQGQTLSANTSTLADADGLGVFGYQWLKAGVAITGATNNNYVLSQSDVSFTISVRVSYTDGRGTTESVTSSASSAVANTNDAPNGLVAIAGTFTQGQTLTATNTLTDLDGMGAVTYQWKADGTAIGAATGNTFTLTEAQVGKAITATASYIDGFGTAESVSSSASALVANVNDAPVGAVTISGTTTQGQTLAVTNNLTDADGLGSITYQWKADGAAIAGANASTLILGQAQVGKAISATASYTDGHGTAESATGVASAAIANVNDPPTGAVTVSGAPTQGQTLAASNTLADLDGMGVVSYQWQANGTAIADATSGYLPLTATEIGKTITVTAQYTDGFGTIERMTSSPTAAIASSDFIAPTVAIFNPPDKAAGVAIASDIVVTFSEPIARGSGSITVKSAAGVTIGTYDAAISSNLGFSGSTLTINPSTDLGFGTEYRVEIAAGAIKDLSGNSYAGTSSYSFSTRAAPDAPKVITGTSANESFTAGSGNDTIDGGAGIDTVVFSGTRASHAITKSGTGWTVNSVADGTDALQNVERLQFSDSNLALDLAAANSAGGIYRLYRATFSRTPDLVGLGYWIDQADKGKSAIDMAIDFTHSQEFQTIFATVIKDDYATGANILALVTFFYQNVLHRAPDVVGRDWYTNEITTHSRTVGQVLAEISDSAENIVQLAGEMVNGIVYIAWHG
jgi:methionine-rich copper-binding protein CopC